MQQRERAYAALNAAADLIHEAHQSGAAVLVCSGTLDPGSAPRKGERKGDGKGDGGATGLAAAAKAAGAGKAAGGAKAAGGTAAERGGGGGGGTKTAGGGKAPAVKELPPGWTCIDRVTANGRKYSVYRGPSKGDSADSKVGAWRRHAAQQADGASGGGGSGGGSSGSGDGGGGAGAGAGAASAGGASSAPRSSSKRRTVSRTGRGQRANMATNSS